MKTKYNKFELEELLNIKRFLNSLRDKDNLTRAELAELFKSFFSFNDLRIADAKRLWKRVVNRYYKKGVN